MTKTSNINKALEKTISIQVISVWTLLASASYVVGNLWLKNYFLSHLLLWFVGTLILGLVLSWYYKATNKKTDTNDETLGNIIYRAMLETSPDSVAATDLLGNYIFANKQTAVLHGYDKTEEFIGKNALSLVAINDVPKAMKYMNITRADGIIKNVEFNLFRKDGTTFPAELSAALVKNEFGIPIAFIAVTRDITDQKRVANQLNEMNEQLRLQLKEIEKLQSILKEQVIQDPLTGLYNRRYLEEASKQEFARARRENQTFSIVILDIDNLKKINDLHGHLIGDQAIKKLGALLKKTTREEDIACRYGGDEFLIVLHDTPPKVAAERVESWRSGLLASPLILQGQPLTVRFTAGIAAFPQHGTTLDEIFHNADKMLYLAKAAGKDQALTHTG